MLKARITPAKHMESACSGVIWGKVCEWKSACSAVVMCPGQVVCSPDVLVVVAFQNMFGVLVDVVVLVVFLNPVSPSKIGS